MNRRDFAKLLGSLACAGGLRAAEFPGASLGLLTGAPPARRPNFLFIAIDDLKPILGHQSEEPDNFLSILYPDPAKRAAVARVLSPNMDRLAAEGVDFRRACCPAALCNPSRTALLTGIRPSQSGIYINRDSPDVQFRHSAKSFVRAAVTLPQNLRAHGYYTAGMGKVFHKGIAEGDKDWPDQAHSWSTWINAPEDDGVQAGTGRAILSPWSINDPELRFGVRDCRTEAMDDYRKADAIARVLETGSATARDQVLNQDKTIALPDGQPFFLACGLFRPHLPWLAPQEFIDRFRSDDIQITRAYYDAVVADLGDLPPGGLQLTGRPRADGTPNKGRFSRLLRHGRTLDQNDGDLKSWREAIRHYLAAVAFADHCVGRLLGALDHSRYRDNTVVVLWSDHGWELGPKYRMGKDSLWDESCHCVLTVRDPGQAEHLRGRPCRRPVGLQDVYRTVCGRAGVPVPAYVAGSDLHPVLADPDAPWDETALTTRRARNHAICDGRFRYIRYEDDPKDAELYDQQADPRDLTNLIGDPDRAHLRQIYDRRLDQMLHAGPFAYDTAGTSVEASHLKGKGGDNDEQD